MTHLAQTASPADLHRGRGICFQMQAPIQAEVLRCAEGTKADRRALTDAPQFSLCGGEADCGLRRRPMLDEVPSSSSKSSRCRTPGDEAPGEVRIYGPNQGVARFLVVETPNKARAPKKLSHKFLEEPYSRSGRACNVSTTFLACKGNKCRSRAK